MSALTIFIRYKAEIDKLLMRYTHATFRVFYRSYIRIFINFMDILFHLISKKKKTILIKHDWEEASLSQISTTLIQFADCDTEFLNRLHMNHILGAWLLQHVLTISVKL